MYSQMTTFASYRDLGPLGPKEPRRIVAIGNFDGVHRGHQALFALCRERAQATSAKALALTFWPHPAKVLSKTAPPALLSTRLRRRELIAACGLDLLVEEPFNEAFAALSPEAFIGEILVNGLCSGEVCVGYDFNFGKGRSGTTQTLVELLSGQGVPVHILPPHAEGGVVCSSSKVRQAVKDCDLELASRLLGRPYEVEGIVVRGAGRGRLIGIPTANLNPETELFPPCGIYAAYAERLDGDRNPIELHQAAVSVGQNPTFVTDPMAPPVIEAHLLLEKPAFPDLYDQRIRLSFVRKLRDEIRFESVESLVLQIHRDIEEARFFLPIPERGP